MGTALIIVGFGVYFFVRAHVTEQAIPDEDEEEEAEDKDNPRILLQ